MSIEGSLFLIWTRCGWKYWIIELSSDVPYIKYTTCRNVNAASFPFKCWLCHFLIFYRYAEPFLRDTIFVPYYWLWFSKTCSTWYYNTTGRHTYSQVTCLKVKVITFHKQTIFLVHSYECFQCKYFLLHMPTVDEKKELHVELLVKMSKVTFRRLSGCTYFLTGYRAVSLIVFYLHFCQNWDMHIVGIVRTCSISSYTLNLNQK